MIKSKLSYKLYVISTFECVPTFHTWNFLNKSTHTHSFHHETSTLGTVKILFELLLHDIYPCRLISRILLFTVLSNYHFVVNMYIYFLNQLDAFYRENITIVFASYFLNFLVVHKNSNTNGGGWPCFLIRKRVDAFCIL